jgi:hypothetical protein
MAALGVSAGRGWHELDCHLLDELDDGVFRQRRVRPPLWHGHISNCRTDFSARASRLSGNADLLAHPILDVPPEDFPQDLSGSTNRTLVRKRLTNTPVRQAGSVLKCPDDRKNRVVSTQATYPCGSSAVGGRVCEQRYAAERVLPESRFELQHTGSPSKETALEEKAYANFFGWWLGAGGVGDQEIADAAGTELWAGRGPAGRPRRLATSARSARVSATPSLSPISL